MRTDFCSFWLVHSNQSINSINQAVVGYLSGPPILISPESAAGIKAGAKTGLSTLICGILFGISTFFSPIFAAGTLLIYFIYTCFLIIS